MEMYELSTRTLKFFFSYAFISNKNNTCSFIFAFNYFEQQGAHWSRQNNQTPNLPVTDPLLYKNKVVLIKPLFIITIGFSLQPVLYYKKYSASFFI